MLHKYSQYRVQWKAPIRQRSSQTVWNTSEDITADKPDLPSRQVPYSAQEFQGITSMVAKRKMGVWIDSEANTLHRLKQSWRAAQIPAKLIARNNEVSTLNHEILLGRIAKTQTHSQSRRCWTKILFTTVATRIATYSTDSTNLLLTEFSLQLDELLTYYSQTTIHEDYKFDKLVKVSWLSSISTRIYDRPQAALSRRQRIESAMTSVILNSHRH
jgi:hypothetical protein